MRSGWGARRYARTVRALAALTALVLVVVPQQSGFSASFKIGLPEIEKTGQAGGAEMVPMVAGEQLVMKAALPFVASYGDAASPLRAEDCLTQAVYYEGALEPDLGQRAIAQVVLNRVRHPEYPNSVCGVVFQGQHLSTSCQFTFTCDGSRTRAPMLSLWRKANLVAKAALGGAVVKDVGLATHYHADYVTPYWSPTLDKTGQIGRHIFYRWRGRAGRLDAFSSAYSGREPLIGDWIARAAGPIPPALTAGHEAGGGEGLVAMPDADARPPQPALTPFKARPLHLETGQDQPL